MKQIPLTQGKFALVDDEMFDYLSNWKWFAVKAGGGYFYAARKSLIKNSNGELVRRNLFMHRVITGVTDPKKHIDHINHHTLDNQSSNLRICTASENGRNSTSQKNSSSKYLGVSWSKHSNKWRAAIVVNRKFIHIGFFNSETAAALKYNEFALKHFGDFANPNIIPESNLFTAQNAAI